MTVKLKPCPFCREDHKDMVFVADDTDGKDYETYVVSMSVVCNGCGTNGPTSYNSDKSLYECQQEAIKKWNKRI